MTVELLGPSTLGEAIGVSSSYIPLMMPTLNRELSKMIGGPASSALDFQQYKATQTEWADGGGVDVLGIYPLLRRRVSKVIAWVACNKDAIVLDDFSNVVGRGHFCANE